MNLICGDLPGAIVQSVFIVVVGVIILSLISTLARNQPRPPDDR